jgi:hypothetical chaperone protein
MHYCAIDFGTSNSAVAVPASGSTEAEAVSLVEVEAHQRTIPTAVFFNTEDGSREFGRAAMASYIDGREGRLMRSMKSVLGTSLIDERTQIKGQPAMRFVDIIASFLKHLKSSAEMQVGSSLDQVVLGRPVFFVDDDAKRDRAAQAALESAAQSIGFRDIAFQFEPIAAAFDYESKIDREQLVLVADIGGGTSDFSLVRLGPDRIRKAQRSSDILAHHGVHVAGTDFDQQVELQGILPLMGYKGRGPQGREVPHRIYFDLATWHLINTVYASKRVAELQAMMSFYADPVLHQRLMRVVTAQLGHNLMARAEQAKITVAAGGSTWIDLSSVEAQLGLAFSETDLRHAVQRDLGQVTAAALTTVRLGGIEPEQVETLYFTGGSTGLHFLAEQLMQALPKAIPVYGDRFASVATGLGIHAQRLYGSKHKARHQ